MPDDSREVRRERGGEEERGGDEGEEKDQWKAAYQNVGKGIETTNVLLNRGREEEWDFVFVAEAWEGKNGERTTHQGYRTFS